MSSQYERRKAKEAAKMKEIAEKRDAVKKKITKNPKKELTHLSIDVILTEGKHEAVIIRYNPETKEAKVEEIRPTNRGVGILFENKKTALKKLLHLD